MSRKDEYLYVMVDDRVWRLNLRTTKLGEESCRLPDFELVCDYISRSREFPIGMSCMCVGSKLYMLGGEIEQRITDADGITTESNYIPNLDVFALYFDDGSSASIRVCEDDDVPRTMGPKINPIVVSVNEKVYVLSTGSYYERQETLEPPVFEVFDPVHQSWRNLPDPLWTDPAHDDKLSGSVYHHFVWDHKIIYYHAAGLYIFDTDTEKWDFAEDWSPPFPIVHCAATEKFEGFLVAMPDDRQQLVAYQFNSEGIIKPYRVLDELSEVFKPPFDEYEVQGFLIPFGGSDGDGDGGRKICFLLAGLDHRYGWCARVAIFGVSTSFNNAGDRVPYAVLETLQHYNMDKYNVHAQTIVSALVMCDDLNKYGVEAASFMDANLSGLDRDTNYMDLSVSTTGGGSTLKYRNKCYQCGAVGFNPTYEDQDTEKMALFIEARAVFETNLRVILVFLHQTLMPSSRWS